MIANDMMDLINETLALKRKIDEVKRTQLEPLESLLATKQESIKGFMSLQNLKHLDTQDGHRVDLITRTIKSLDESRLNVDLQGKLDDYRVLKTSSFIKLTLKDK